MVASASVRPGRWPASRSWSGAAVAAEGVLWPAERRIQAGLAVGAPDGTALRRDCRVVEVAGALLGAVFLVATVLMVARPG